MQRRLIGTQQGHAVLAAGDQQSLKVERRHQLSALAHQLGLIGTMSDDRLELARVRRNQRSAAVDFKILALGVGEDRNAATARSRISA